MLNFMILRCTDSDIWPCIHFCFSLLPKSMFFLTWRTFQLEKKNNNCWVVGNCSNVVCKVPCKYKKITIRVLATHIFLYLEDTSTGKKTNNFWVVGNCSNVVCKVPCWHKKMTIRVLATSARIANKNLSQVLTCKLSPYRKP